MIPGYPEPQPLRPGVYTVELNLNCSPHLINPENCPEELRTAFNEALEEALAHIRGLADLDYWEYDDVETRDYPHNR